MTFGLRDAEVMRSLEEAEDWGRLEVWMMVIWQSLPPPSMVSSSSVGEIEQVTLKLLLRRLSALPRFEDLCQTATFLAGYKIKLRRICDQAQAEQ